MNQHDPVLVMGSIPLTSSVVACLLQAGHPVLLLTDDEARMEESIRQHLSNENPIRPATESPQWTFLSALPASVDVAAAILLTEEVPGVKQDAIRRLDAVLTPDTLIAVNTESIPLDTLQADTRHPQRVMGLNWSEPAHTTYFLEIITNEQNDAGRAEQFCDHARAYWQKDPYVLRTGMGIRSRMLCALIREAFYLVQNGYVTVDDIDRACRNDAGYYLPFAGNFRYMDLMGTFVYGVVMQDLNPELSQRSDVPAFFRELTDQGHRGMASGKGFYEYTDGEVAERTEQFRQFSYQIQALIARYPYDPILAPSLPSPLPYVYE
jgi:3-hydroxybutyryl-CoA dehydrogenase